MGRPVLPAGEVEAGPDDAVGIDAVVAVDVLDRPGLAEAGHAESDAGHLVDGGQEREGVRVSVKSRQCSAVSVSSANQSVRSAGDQTPTLLIQPPRLVLELTSGLTVTTRLAASGASLVKSRSTRPSAAWVDAVPADVRRDRRHRLSRILRPAAPGSAPHTGASPGEIDLGGTSHSG